MQAVSRRPAEKNQQYYRTFPRLQVAEKCAKLFVRTHRRKGIGKLTAVLLSVDRRTVPAATAKLAEHRLFKRRFSPRGGVITADKAGRDGTSCFKSIAGKVDRDLIKFLGHRIITCSIFAPVRHHNSSFAYGSIP